MTKIGELPIQRSDGAYDDIDLYELGTFDREPLLVQLSDGRWGTPYLEPLGDGDTGLLVQASDGTWYQANRQGIVVIEDWESGDYSNWGFVNGTTIVTSPTYEGAYALQGDAGGGNQSVHDNEADHNTLPHYQQRGETARVYAMYPVAEGTNAPDVRVRWGFGGIFEDTTGDHSLYAQWNIENSGLHLIDSDGHTTLASTYDFTYDVGGEWWAVEVEWTDPTIYVRLLDYSDPDNPVLQDSLQYDYTLDDTVLGHQWYVWNDSPDDLYSDYAIIPPQ